jgi:hypothetical protein
VTRRGDPPPFPFTSRELLHARCGRPVGEHPGGNVAACRFEPDPEIEFVETDPNVPVVTVCGLPEQIPPQLLRALADLGTAAAAAFDVPYTVVEVDRDEP